MIKLHLSNDDVQSFWASLCDQLSIVALQKKIDIRKRGIDVKAERFTITNGFDVIFTEFNAYSPTEIVLEATPKSKGYKIDLGLFNTIVSLDSSLNSCVFPAQLFYPPNASYSFKLPLHTDCQWALFFFSEEFLKSVSILAADDKPEPSEPLFSLLDLTAAEFHDAKNIFKKPGQNRLVQVHQYAWRVVSQWATHSLQKKSNASHINHNGKDVEKMSAFIQKLPDASLRNRMSVKDMADEVQMSVTKFKTLFKDITGVNAYEFYLSTRMQKAQEMLLAGYTVGQISQIMGYAAPIKFLQSFKSVVGETPGKWARNHR